MENISKSPFGNLLLQCTIFSKYFPASLLYLNENNHIIIVEWITYNKDDIFYAYKISKKDLKNYITKNLSHIGLIKSAINDEYYEFAYSNLNEFKKHNFESLDHSALPKPSAYFDKDDILSDDYKVILTIIKNKNE